MKKHAKIILWAGLVIVAAYVVWRLASVKTVQPPEIPLVDEAVQGDGVDRDFVSERMSDPVYVEALKGLIDERRQTIAEAHVVRRQMDAILDAALVERDAGRTGEQDADTQPGVVESTPTASDASVAAQTDDLAAAPPAISPPALPPAADLSGIDTDLRERVRQHPDWAGLETRLDMLAARQQSIQVRTQALIRERMIAQVDPRRPADGGVPPVRPPAEIKRQTNMIEMITEPTVITDLPDVNLRGKLPPVPERKPVEWR